MIVEYLRPQSIEDALKLLARPGIKTVPIGGGTVINQPSEEALAVVDLQSLGLNQFQSHGQALELGAMVTLQALVEFPDLQPALRQVVLQEAAYNIRQVATIAGSIVSATGRSPLATSLLSLDTRLVLQPGNEQIDLGEVLFLRLERLQSRLVTSVILPMNVNISYQAVSRTPADFPIVCVAAAMWPSGRVRLALGGYGKAPILAMDGPEAHGYQEAVFSAFSEAGDEWASAQYRQKTARILASRALRELGAKGIESPSP